MRKVLSVLSFAILALLLIGNPTMSQQEFTQEQLDAWQAIAETYYVEGVDENALMGDLSGLEHAWAYNNPSLIQPGMYAPDFLLMDLYGDPYTVSQYRGNTFVVVISGSWY